MIKDAVVAHRNGRPQIHFSLDQDRSIGLEPDKVWLELPTYTSAMPRAQDERNT
jgi:hypothetical protein